MISRGDLRIITQSQGQLLGEQVIGCAQEYVCVCVCVCVYASQTCTHACGPPPFLSLSLPGAGSGWG